MSIFSSLIELFNKKEPQPVAQKRTKAVVSPSVNSNQTQKITPQKSIKTLKGAKDLDAISSSNRNRNDDDDVGPIRTLIKPAGSLSSKVGSLPAKPDISNLSVSSLSFSEHVQNAEAATNEDINILENYKGEVVTVVEGGPFHINKNQQARIAAFDNGTVLIATKQEQTPQVIAVLSSLERSKYPIAKVYFVEMGLIRQINEDYVQRSGGYDRSRDTAHMQRHLINLIRTAADLKCSDIHITVQKYEAKVRIRSDGVMMPLHEIPSNIATELLVAAFNMADASDSSYKPFDYQGARITGQKQPLPEGVQAVRLQFNPLPDSGRYLIMRLLYAQKTSLDADIDSLGYAKNQILQIRRMRAKPFGINVISGPTGSGKSTTLQMSLSALMREKGDQINIVTIEDPPEYEIKGAQQLPVTNASTAEEREEAFRKGITAVLRSDPDVIMIGEIRDDGSAQLAFESAMTGHQVWTSLHANDGISIIDRLRDKKVEDYKLCDASLVTGLIGQRLLRRLCPHCKISYKDAYNQNLIDPDHHNYLMKNYNEQFICETVFIANPSPCEKCRKTGYAGRTVAAETILPDLKFMELMKADKKIEAISYWKNELEGLTMLEHAFLKMLKGETTPDEIANKVGILDEVEPDRIKMMLERNIMDIPHLELLPKE